MFGFETRKVNDSRTVVIDSQGRTDCFGTLARFGSVSDRIATANAILGTVRGMYETATNLRGMGVGADATNGIRNEADRLAGIAFWVAVGDGVRVEYSGEMWEIDGGDSREILIYREDGNRKITEDISPTDVTEYAEAVSSRWFAAGNSRDGITSCDCGCVEGNYPCEYGSAGDGCGF